MTAELWDKLFDKLLSTRAAALVVIIVVVLFGKQAGLSPGQINGIVIGLSSYIVGESLRPAELQRNKVKRMARETLAVEQPIKALEMMGAPVKKPNQDELLTRLDEVLKRLAELEKKVK